MAAFEAALSYETYVKELLSEDSRKREYNEVTKTTAPRIPVWSPTMVLTGRYSG
jgi:hypothetical protein